MRVLRRIAGCMRYKRCESDLEVRRRLKAPSVECVFARARLRYVRRVVLRQPKTLLALLAVRYKGQLLPWVSLVLADLRAMRSAVACCCAMPDPECDASPWVVLMQNSAKWMQALSCFKYYETCIGAADSHVVVTSATAPAGAWDASGHIAFKCNMCESAFLNAKALLAHQRTKHQRRVEQRYYSNKEGVCQCCGTMFHTHARLLRHLTDRRRTRCWTSIQSDPANFTRLSEAEVQELDAWYRAQKALACRAGHSHVQSAKPAMTNAGKMVGHVRR